jgi:predicted AlkP superfamily phosphohydrolase/phosphomutase
VRQRRVLLIGLDGYEQSLGDQFMAEGLLPGLAALRSRSARFLLDHGPAARSGLTWEHASTGQAPEITGHESVVYFDTSTYQVWQEGTSLVPFAASLNARTVIFDPPYFDLQQAPSVRGITNWGAHDPGVTFSSRPAELAEELLARFGAYPAADTMYEIVWQSRKRMQEFSDLLIRSTEIRARAASWLLKERCPDWDLGFVVAGEIHSGIEAMWHGIDSSHPLHSVPSAPIAGQGLRDIYRATDTLVADLVSAFPDATVVAFAMGGMGPNRSDVASMSLLAELLYRNAFGKPLMRDKESWSNAPQSIPMLKEESDWANDIKPLIVQRTARDVARSAAIRLLPRNIRMVVRRFRQSHSAISEGVLRLPLDWIPASLYQPYWRQMRFFALPSFYDGRVRINLAGREREGAIRPEDYHAVCAEIESLLRECRDVQTGEPVVDQVERYQGRDPLKLGPTDCDLVITWRGAALGFEHPTLGRIGPLPYRRTGGHTGPYGIAYLAGDGIAAGDFGVRSSFDVVPTITELLGEHPSTEISGQSLLVTTQDMLA